MLPFVRHFGNERIPVLAPYRNRTGAEQLPLHPSFQTSTCSAIARASSTSMPRYRTVLSIFVWPSNN